MKRRILCALMTAALCASTFAPAGSAEETPAAKGTRENPYLLGEVCAFEAEIYADGSPRTDTAEADYQTVSLSLTLDNYLTPDYFNDHYSRLYRLDGTEAGAQVTLTNAGAQAVLPQSAFWLTLEDARGAQTAGYMLMDAEVSGRYDIQLEPGQTQTVYKRFSLEAEQEMRYLVLTWCQGGERISRYFLLEALVIYPEMENGSRGDSVVDLQQRLIELGYLDDEADGIFGSRTEAAVSAAQAAAGLNQTGVADDAFQHRLYADTFPQSDGQ